MKVKILYVEDEAILAKIVQEGLEKLKFEVCYAADGRQALEVFERCQPDLCLLDVMMPVMDGFTLGKTIRAQNPLIPILYLTAKSATEDVVEGFSSGGNDYLKKPFSMQELNARINNLLNLTNNRSTRDSNTDGPIEIGRYTYEKDKQTLTIDDRSVSLSFREHELLSKLLKSNKAVVERRYLLKEIWGDDSFFHSRNLDVYIRKLRQYFLDDEQVQIITLKGVGYRFVY